MLQYPTYKNFTAGVLFLLAAAACSTTKSGKSVPVVPIVILPGYALKDTNISKKDFNIWVVTTQTSFDSLFTAVIPDPGKPSFDQKLVVAVNAVTATSNYKVTFRNMLVRRNVLNVYFNVTREKAGAENTDWVSISNYPRDRNLRRVNFYFDDVLVRSVPVVVVY